MNIQSDFKIAEMLPAEFDREDVRIVMAETPESIENPIREGVRFQLTNNEFLLKIDKVARYYVADGSAIRIEKSNGSTYQELRLFLLGVVFSALLHQRGMVPFHASALKSSSEKGFLICGRSGIGKSTLTAYLLKQGYSLLSDDLSVVRPKEAEIWVYPSFPFLKLWKDVMEHLEFSAAEGIKLREPLEKFGYWLEESFYPDPVRVNTVFVLHAHNKETYVNRELKGIEKFDELRYQTARMQFMVDKYQSRHFGVVNQLARSAKVIRITRPQKPMDTERLYEEIKKASMLYTMPIHRFGS